MSSAHARSRDEQPDLSAALTRLGPTARRLALRRLAHARDVLQRTGDPQAVDHVVRSVLLTCAMESTPGYATAVGRSASSTAEAMDVADVVARLEAHDRDPAT